MDEIGIQLSKEDPTFTSVVTETRKLHASLPQADEELYGKWKRLEGHEEFLDLQEVSTSLLLCWYGRWACWAWSGGPSCVGEMGEVG